MDLLTFDWVKRWIRARGAINVKDYGAKGDGTTDDTAAINAAIAACPVGGQVYFPNGIYKITAALTVSDHITLLGESMVETWKGRTETPTGSLNAPLTPFLKGAVIKQFTAATDIIKLTGTARTVHLRDLGLLFEATIADTNTGHGVNATPTATSGSGHDTGLEAAAWRNVTVYGVDGDHYGFKFINPHNCTFQNVRSYGGGGIYAESDSYEGNLGNLVFIHPYVWLNNSGTANAYELRARAHGVTGELNLIHFIRPECICTGPAATAGTQYMWRQSGGGALPRRIRIDAPDLESNGSNPIDFGGNNTGTVVTGGGLLTSPATGGVPRDGGYQKFVASGTFTVPDGVDTVRVRCIGGGGGGGGGGSALTSGGVTNQAGGGGGGAAVVAEGVLTGLTFRADYTITIGAGGTSGAGGAANSNPGGSGGNGGQTSFGSDVKANGGGGAGGGGANSNSGGNGGYYARTGNISNSNIPGFGGNGQSPNGLSAFPLPPGVCGGGGGGAGDATHGGGGGSGATVFPDYTVVGGGSQGTQGTTAGGAGTTATAPGSGGGGGGGGAPGGAGGNGGVGAGGMVEVWW